MVRKKMRIVTRPDFDGIVCAVLLKEALEEDLKIVWMEPNDIQSGRAEVQAGDILANLPCHPDAAFWFDHHVSNTPENPILGAFEIAPSAAGVVSRYYQASGKLDNRFDELVKNTDIIDSADLTMEQVNAPEDYPYLLLSMTIKNNNFSDIEYWNHLVEMLRTDPIARVMADEQVRSRSRKVIRENQAFGQYLRDHTRIEDRISITDFRVLDPVPSGNRFLTYSLFPETIASVRIRYKGPDKAQVLLSVGKSIFKKESRINIGHLLTNFGGGGHDGAGGCTLNRPGAQAKIDEIIEVMKANKAEPQERIL